jgi:phosphatidylinositol phospholipase C beta
MDALSDPRAFLSNQEKRAEQLKAIGIDESDISTKDVIVGGNKERKRHIWDSEKEWEKEKMRKKEKKKRKWENERDRGGREKEIYLRLYPVT